MILLGLIKSNMLKLPLYKQMEKVWSKNGKAKGGQTIKNKIKHKNVEHPQK